jgi:hypothetical protein
MELLAMIQTHRSQCGADGPLSRSEDRASEQHLNMSPNALGEKWREWGQNLYHGGR